LINVFGTLAFPVVFAAITFMAPRRPFLALRAVPAFGVDASAKPALTATASKPAEKPAGEAKTADAAKPGEAKPAPTAATK